MLNGQKVWTSMARDADWGICLARTAPDRPKHEGISCFMVDMKTPGIDIRPLRELTGLEMFNEVFFDDVFVPEDCLVGAEHDGWRSRARRSPTSACTWAAATPSAGWSSARCARPSRRGGPTTLARRAGDLRDTATRSRCSASG